MNDDAIISFIQGLTADSRLVQKGWLFAAVPGKHADGHHFINDAINNGATIILASEQTELPKDSNVILVTDKNVRRRFALLAATFYAKQPRTTVAVTGTNGKTSTVNFTAQLWDALGHTSASLGTLGIVSRITMKAGGLTTPDPVSLHAELADLAAAGVTHLAMEASSIGLDQCRLDGVKLSGAAFTNLTRDHIDYHGTMDMYFDSKARLFRDLLPKDAPAIINVDDPYGERLVKTIQNIFTIGFKGKDLQLEEQTPTPFGQILQVKTKGKTHKVVLPLVGLFQGMNALTAAGLVMATENVSFADLVPHIEKLTVVAGRLQRVDGHPKGAAVYVDYAHTPHGLETVLKALRPHTEGKLVVVFGCGGDRDKGKRPMMGGIAAQLADHVIVTDDNPRTEIPATIRAEILAGAPDAIEIGDRKTAIRKAVASLMEGDVLVIAGKGHEQGQIIGHEVFPFDDIKETEDAINAL